MRCDLPVYRKLGGKKKKKTSIELGFPWHNRADILPLHTSLSTSVSREERQQTFAGPSKRCTFFIYNRQGIKEATLPSQSQLHTVFCCSHFTIWASFILSFWRGTANSLSSAPWPLCLISVIQLMRPGLWQAAGTRTEGSGVAMCPQISVIRIAPPHLTQQLTPNNRAHVITCCWKFSTIWNNRIWVSLKDYTIRAIRHCKLFLVPFLCLG